MFKVINKSKNIRQLSSLTFLIKAIRLWGINFADFKQACSCLRRLFITFQRTFQRVFDLNEWIRIINCVFIVLLLDSLWPNIEHASKTLFSRFLGFSFTDTDDSQDNRGREGTIFYSTLPLPPAHEHSDIYLQLCMWDDYHIFLIAPPVFTRLLLDEIYHLIELLFDWLIMRGLLLFVSRLKAYCNYGSVHIAQGVKLTSHEMFMFLDALCSRCPVP